MFSPQCCLHVRLNCPSVAQVEHEPDCRGTGGTLGQKGRKKGCSDRSSTITRYKGNSHTFPLNSHTFPFGLRVIVFYRVTVCTPSVYFHEKSLVLTLKNTTAKAERCRKPVDFKGLRLL